MFSIKLNITRSIDIEKSLFDIQSYVSDFEEWKNWSPWSHMEPTAITNITGDGKSVGSIFSWEGTYTGEGEMERTVLSNSKIEQQIRFKKPFASTATAVFTLEMLPYSVTRVTWSMETKLPFFLFFIKGMFERMMGLDFERGLSMLKTCVEKGEVFSHVEIIKEEKQMEEMYYIGLESSDPMEKIGEKIHGMCMELSNYIKKQKIQTTGPMMTVYHHIDMVKNVFHYSVAVPVAEVDARSDRAIVSGYLPAQTMCSAIHKGSYQFVRNGWAGLMSFLQFQQKKQKKGVPALEVYVNTPETTVEKDLITELYIPV